MVWSPTGFGNHNGHVPPGCHHNGHHEPAQQSIPHLAADMRICVPWTASCQHGLRDVLLHQFHSRSQVLFRPQAGTLHENPAQDPLRGADGRHSSIERNPSRRPELDVCQCPGDLYSSSRQRLQLPHRSGPLQRLYIMGSDWPSEVLRRRRSVPKPRMGFPYWRRGASRNVVPLEKDEAEYTEKDQFSCPLRQP